MRRPSRTVRTIEPKSSSSSTRSAASRATSVPRRPIATPMCAAFSAGASLTPSPVIATTSPFAFSASTMRSFCSGMMRANTPHSRMRATSSKSSIRSNSSPVMVCVASMPASAAIARAVAG
uniref:Uncharacterized protein n=1 Tax=Mizugakiibacter sediminis TaxID=1475481 RepID=A0A0S6Z131_9GAMM